MPAGGCLKLFEAGSMRAIASEVPSTSKRVGELGREQRHISDPGAAPSASPRIWLLWPRLEGDG
jgi:hypothetical protein